MTAIDTAALLQPVSDEAPTGEDLEYDPAFQAMELAAKGRAEQQVGDEITPAEEPEWKEVGKQALDVLGRSHDLRAAVYLARAALRTEGFAGLANGLTLIRGLIENDWETLHPELDPDDDNDPTMRVNALEALADMDATLLGVRAAPLVASRMLGRFGLRELGYADGTLALPENFDGDPPNAAAIDAAFMDADLDELIATHGAINIAIDQLEAIDALMREKVDVTYTPNLKPLSDMLATARAAMVGPMERRGIGVEPADETGDEDGGTRQQRISGEVTSREDVVRSLDKICEYYQRAEPASPVPLLLRRARRLVTMDFMEIVRDLTPSGVSEAEWFRGPEEES